MSAVTVGAVRGEVHSMDRGGDVCGDALTEAVHQRLLERLVRYAEVNTVADPHSADWPSNPNELLLGAMVCDELRAVGVSDVQLDNNGYVTAVVPGTGTGALGLIAHLDVSDACGDAPVRPLVHPHWDGTPIALPAGPVLSPVDNADLASCVGQTLVTSSGDTVLGADDKAGIAIIVTAVEQLVTWGGPRPTLYLVFTPDEEIGRSMERFPRDRFPVRDAVTVDGTGVGVLNAETFAAYGVTVEFTGVATHPGAAKGKMVNALRHAAAFVARLPQDRAPETTEGRQGFVHPVAIRGDAAHCRVELIVRDFSEAVARTWCDEVAQTAAHCAREVAGLGVDTRTVFSYPNMAQTVAASPVRQALEDAVRAVGLTPVWEPVRGGTDGALLASLGVAAPNLFTGARDIHSATEWVCVRDMGFSLCALLRLVVGMT